MNYSARMNHAYSPGVLNIPGKRRRLQKMSK